MAQILKFPAPAAKFGYKRVKRRPENPDQLHLFPRPSAQILTLTPALKSFEYALLLDEKGDARAAELYAKAIEEQDCVADAYCNLGVIESQRGNVAKAFDCFTASLKHNPRHTEAHYNLANLYFDVDDFRLAQIHYELAREIEPSFANVYFNLGLVQAINNDPAAAINSLSKYKELVSAEDARNVEELLRNLKASLDVSHRQLR